jgi:hypothetical protein
MGIEWDMMHQQYLVGGLEHFLFFHSVGNVIIPTVTHSIIFRRGRSTTNQIGFLLGLN